MRSLSAPFAADGAILTSTLMRRALPPSDDRGVAPGPSEPDEPEDIPRAFPLSSAD